MPRLFAVIALAVVILIALCGCTRQDAGKKQEGTDKIRVVTTLFPLYDFARTIAGDKAAVKLLLPPGTEPHHFEPRPEDIANIGKARLFIYTNRTMEPWADKIIAGGAGTSAIVVDAGKGATYLPAAGEHDHDHHGEGGYDPHIWLDFGNAAKMVDNIRVAFIQADPANRAAYERNAEALKKALAGLDEQYRKGLADCATRTLVQGGHFTFGYPAKRYNLDYHALTGISAQSEPSAARMAVMIRQIRTSKVRYIFAEELLSPRLTETLAAETGVKVLMLNGAHNLSQDDYKAGRSFAAIMESNLTNLRKGLECR